MSDVTFDMRWFNQMNIHRGYAEPWSLIDTGDKTDWRAAEAGKEVAARAFCFTMVMVSAM